MSEQEPLKVRVARALGLTVNADKGLAWDREMGCWVELPNYAADPSWWGPMIEANRLQVDYDSEYRWWIVTSWGAASACDKCGTILCPERRFATGATLGEAVAEWFCAAVAEELSR